MKTSETIKLVKRTHRSKIIMLLRFTGRRDWLEQIKSLPKVAYSATLSSYYLPYDKEAFNHFLSLEIPFVPIDTIGSDSLPSANISLEKREIDLPERAQSNTNLILECRIRF